MRKYESFLTLLAELDGDATEIARLREQNIRAWGRIQAIASLFFESFQNMHASFREKLETIAKALLELSGRLTQVLLRRQS